jgi:hypothetical protein
MDMPALYSLVRPDGQECDAFLQEQSHFSRAGFASSTKAQLALSFKTKVPGIFGADKAVKLPHPQLRQKPGWGCAYQCSSEQTTQCCAHQ